MRVGDRRPRNTQPLGGGRRSSLGALRLPGTDGQTSHSRQNGTAKRATNALSRPAIITGGSRVARVMPPSAGCVEPYALR